LEQSRISTALDGGLSECYNTGHVINDAG